MKRILSTVIVLLGLGASVIPAAAVTHWTDTLELHVEHTPPVAWDVAEFTLYFTRLDGSKPVAGATVSVALLAADGNRQDLGAAREGPAGVYALTGTFPAAGTYDLEVVLRADVAAETLRPGALTVHAAASEVPAGHPPAGAITFLKEQQWQVPFATEPAAERDVLRSAWAIAEVQPSPAAYAEITAPVDGVLQAGGAGDLALPGQTVKRGDVLARLAPPLSGDGWAASQLALAQTQREFERAQRLKEKDAISERDYEAARTAYLAQQAGYERLAASGEGNLLTLTAPLDGQVIDWKIRPGQRLQVGDHLMSIADPNLVWLKVNVYEADYRRLGTPVGAHVKGGGDEDGWTIPAADLRVLTTGGALDPVTRTLPILLEVVNTAGRLTLGESTPVELFAGEGTRAISVPQAALYQDEGRDVVFVQIAGEVFVKRPVTTGPSHAGRVSILEGLRAGERVVVRGGYFVKLAATTEQVGQGHSH